MLPIVDLVEGQAILDTSHADKQPDWTYEPTWSGASPVDVLADQPVHVETPASVRRRPNPSAARCPTSSPTRSARCSSAIAGIRDAAQRVASMADDPAAAVDAIVALDDELRQHDDLGERVLYRLLDRHLGGIGDESSAWPTSRPAAGDRAGGSHRRRRVAGIRRRARI